MKLEKLFILVVSILLSANVFSADTELDTLNSNWTIYNVYNGVKVEYRMQEFEVQGRLQNWLIFRFTNSNSSQVNCTWNIKLYRDNICSNCEEFLENEFKKELLLESNEQYVTNSTPVNGIRFSEFGNFITMVDGMTNTKLTGFEIINFTTD